MLGKEKKGWPYSGACMFKLLIKENGVMFEKSTPIKSAVKFIALSAHQEKIMEKQLFLQEKWLLSC